MLENSEEDYNLELDLNYIGKNRNAKFRIFKPKKAGKIYRRREKYHRAKELVEDLGIDFNRAIVYLDGSFIMGDFVEAFLKDNDLKAKRILISTLGVNQDNIDSLRNLVEFGRCEKLDLVVSDYFYAHNKQNVDYIYENLDINNSFQLAVTRTHIKLILIELENGDKILIDGSANLRSSKCLEIINIEKNDELFDFHMHQQELIIEEFKTINFKLPKYKLLKKYNNEEEA